MFPAPREVVRELYMSIYLLFDCNDWFPASLEVDKYLYSTFVRDKASWK